jgi:hypothetical protein
MMLQTANNDDIFLCYDRDEIRPRKEDPEQRPAQSQVGPRVIKPPNTTAFNGVSM